MIFAGASSDWLGRVIGAFLLASVPLRRVLTSGRLAGAPRALPVLGGVFGLLSAIVVAIGAGADAVLPGLRAAAGRLHRHRGGLCRSPCTSRGAWCFARYRLLTWEVVAIGLVLGATMFAGSWIGRRLLDRMSDRVFLAVIEVLLVVMGLQFLCFPR